MSRRDSGRIARDSGVHQRLILVLTRDRACSGAAKHRASIQRQSESGTGYCGWSEVLGSSVVRAMSPKYRICENRLVCERLISKILLQCALLITALIIVYLV
jgi:hypothetical protein